MPLRLILFVLVLLALCSTVALSAEHTYVVEFSADGGVTWQNAPDQYLTGPYAVWPDVEWLVYELP